MFWIFHIKAYSSLIFNTAFTYKIKPISNFNIIAHKLPINADAMESMMFSSSKFNFKCIKWRYIYPHIHISISIHSSCKMLTDVTNKNRYVSAFLLYFISTSSWDKSLVICYVYSMLCGKNLLDTQFFYRHHGWFIRQRFVA